MEITMRQKAIALWIWMARFGCDKETAYKELGFEYDLNLCSACEVAMPDLGSRLSEPDCTA